MNTKNKILEIIVEEKDIIRKTKELLKKLAAKHKKAAVKVYAPVGVILKSADTNESYAVAYEKEKFVIVAPNGTSELAKLYGNWDEAITNVQRILCGDCITSKNARFVLAQYVAENK